MLTLTANDIRLGARATDWKEALAQAARDLEQAGYTTPDYLDGMMTRERQSSTVLGHGIAIPHGTPESRGAVVATGVRVLQFPDGITWHDGARVHVLVAIAAQSDEHLDILRHLTRVLDTPGLPDTLSRITDAGDLAARLSRTPVTPKCDRETLCLGVAATSPAAGFVAAMRSGRTDVRSDMINGMPTKRETTASRMAAKFSAARAGNEDAARLAS